MVKGLHTTWCQTTDMDRSVAFYRDLLGLKAEMISPYWSQFDLGNGKIGIHPQLDKDSEPRGQVGKGWYLGIEVDDIRATRKTLEAAGVQIADDYHDIPGGVIITFADPDGNPIQAIQMGITLKDFED